MQTTLNTFRVGFCAAKCLNKLSVAITVFVFLTTTVKAQEVVVNSDIHYQPVPAVTLDAYQSVQERDQSEQNPKLAFGVAISGGGSRAQYFGLGALLGLEQIKNETNNDKRNLLEETDYFSTASGGGFAAGYYLTIKKNVLLKKEFNSFNEFWLSPRRTDDLQEYIWQSAVLWDFVAKFGKYEKNKGVSMPAVIDQQLLQYAPENPKKFNQQMRLGDFFVPIEDNHHKPTLPIFVPNGTIFANAERLPFMPHILKALDINRSLLPDDESFKQNPSYQIPLTYAISGSAAFPGILPQVKLGLASNDKVIRVVDGGVVDNLGFKTLIELLAADHNVTSQNKRFLVVDCSAVGETERFGVEGIESRIKILKSSLLFTVDSKYVSRKDDIESSLCLHAIPATNYAMVGLNTIKKTLETPEATKDTALANLRNELRKDVGIKESEGKSDRRWLNLFYRFEDSIKKHCQLKALPGYDVDDDDLNNNKLRTIDFVNFNHFQYFTLADNLMLYELASQIETKIKIYKSEKDILLLAGKYAIYLERNKLRQLYTLDN